MRYLVVVKLAPVPESNANRSIPTQDGERGRGMEAKQWMSTTKERAAVLFLARKRNRNRVSLDRAKKRDSDTVRFTARYRKTKAKKETEK